MAPANMEGTKFQLVYNTCIVLKQIVKKKEMTKGQEYLVEEFKIIGFERSN